ncbi:hypothetical protein HMI54_006597 [Coelomomyces lativittatus]|nr:hypothetical protein HMI54_006597 [Coelomomyces lativittatus]KAJ1510037.1 hypothetical protein HMI56_006527 [Coelomomyces lativittatus]KAJ1516842.1 hypothetical protein HMI55_001250 [Coelomomyces lativittatus]
MWSSLKNWISSDQTQEEQVKNAEETLASLGLDPSLLTDIEPFPVSETEDQSGQTLVLDLDKLHKELIQEDEEEEAEVELLEDELPELEAELAELTTTPITRLSETSESTVPNQMKELQPSHPTKSKDEISNSLN